MAFTTKCSYFSVVQLITLNNYIIKVFFYLRYTLMSLRVKFMELSRVYVDSRV